MFVTVQYALAGSAAREGVTMLPTDLYGKYDKGPAATMEHLHGSSWHGGDAKLVFWFERYWGALVALGGCVALALAAWAYCRWGSSKGSGGGAGGVAFIMGILRRICGSSVPPPSSLCEKHIV